MRKSFACLLLGACSLTPAFAGTIQFGYTEALKRPWRHEVLTFRLKVPKQSADVSFMYVTDENGSLVPAQISDPVAHPEYNDNPVTVTLVADFEPWQQRTWTLNFGGTNRPTAAATDLTVTEEKDTCVLASDRIALRLPRGQQRFETSVPAAQVPAPILAVRGPGGAWLGRGWLESPQRVTGYSATLTHDGPIFKRMRMVYTFEQGRYTCTVTVRTGEDVAHIREEFDLGEPAAERTSHFCFSLTDGLKPDTVRWYGRYTAIDPFKQFITNNPVFSYGGMQEAVFSPDYAKDQELMRLHGLFTWWPQAAHYFGAYQAANPQSDLVAVFPERPGHWRNPTVLFLETKGGNLVLRAPLRQPVQDWVVDGTDYLSPFWTGTVHPGTPRSTGIREWGLMVAKAADVIPAKDLFTASGIRKNWTRYGQNPLDKIKDWTLAWPDPGTNAYPRGAVSAADLPALRERAARIPALQKLLGSAQYKRFTYLVKQDPKLADELLHFDANGDPNGMGLMPRLRWSAGCYLDTQGDLGINTFMHHGNSHMLNAAPILDVCLGMPQMTPDERREARALYAFLLYKISDPDWLAYGAGFHLGNPNMPTMSMSAIGAGAALIPEHPKAYDWMMMSAKSTLDMLRDYTAPGGAWRECPHYQMDASMYGVLQSAVQFRNAGFLDLHRNPFLKSTLLYHAQLLTPVDPRFGIRTIPAIGNGAHEPTSLYGRMAVGTADSDPTFSKWMQWAWKANGGIYMYPNDELVLNEDLPAEQPDLSSRNFPGFGAVMRAHVGSPRETYLIFRMGYQQEHYEDDQGEIVLYSQGAPLLLDFGSQYQPMMARPWMHNRISLNHMTNWRPVGTIDRTGFLEVADAASGTITYDQLYPIAEDPKTPQPPNFAPPPVPLKAPVAWTRQVVLVKHEQAEGPHYVVLRDNFTGKGDEFTDFSLWGLATGVQIRGNVAEYAGQHGVDVSVTLLDPVKPEFTTGQYGHEFLGPVNPFWQKVNPGKKYQEVQHVARVKRDDHGGYFAVIVPHKPGEAAPEFRPWAKGAGAMAEMGGERHVVLCAEQPGRYQDAGVSVDGQRAVVRLGKDQTILGLLDGSSVSASGYTLAANGPSSVTITAAGITGEANLAAAGDLRLTLPQANPALTAMLRLNGQDSPCPLSREGSTLTLSLPAGKSRFVIH